MQNLLRRSALRSTSGVTCRLGQQVRFISAVPKNPFFARVKDDEKSSAKVAVVVGVGSGVGAAAAKKFASEGYYVCMIARTEEYLRSTHYEISQMGRDSIYICTDMGNLENVQKAFVRINYQLGVPHVLVCTAAVNIKEHFLDIQSQDYEKALQGNINAAFYSSQVAGHQMVADGRGTILYTGNDLSLRGIERQAISSVGKFGLRGLAQSTARELGPKGVHVAHVIIDGVLNVPESQDRRPNTKSEELIKPEAVADTLWFLHNQKKGAWIHELDLRTNVERW